MDLGLADRVYVVTGATDPVAHACAEQLVAEGARVVLNDVEARPLRHLSFTLGGSDRALPVPGDLADPGIETCLVAAAFGRYGRLDGALVTVPAPAPEPPQGGPDGGWRLAFEDLFLSPLRLAQAVGERVSNEGGSIVLLLPSSPLPTPRPQVTAALRASLTSAAASLAADLGAFSVRVNLVLTGPPEPDPEPLAADHDPAADDRADRADRADRIGHPDVPLRRRGEPFELARPPVFLLSPVSGYVTGTVLPVDGGAWSANWVR